MHDAPNIEVTRLWALVLCVDEKSQIQALDRTQPLLPSRTYRRHCVPCR